FPIHSLPSPFRHSPSIHPFPAIPHSYISRHSRFPALRAQPLLVSPCGSRALQSLLHFRDPSPVLRALRALPRPALPALARSGPGSRLWDAILASKTVPKPAKKRLLKRLQGHWAALAKDRSGSRVLDTAWACSPLPQRVLMAAELAPHLPELLRDPLGRGAARTLGLELFRRDRPRWEGLHRGRGLSL
uniref:Uncharacterized protein n=1 Tax=Serinus canaria TaxID=9135 RepID=A0A8C9N0B5_SERCA